MLATEAGGYHLVSARFLVCFSGIVPEDFAFTQNPQGLFSGRPLGGELALRSVVLSNVPVQQVALHRNRGQQGQQGNSHAGCQQYAKENEVVVDRVVSGCEHRDETNHYAH